MSPVEIVDAEGKIVEIVSGTKKLPVTTADSLQGTITSISPDSFAFSGSRPRKYKSGKPRVPVLFTQKFGPGCPSQELRLIDGYMAKAISSQEVTALIEAMGR